MHRDYPEAAVLMIPLAEVSAEPENVVRLWFDRAVAAQFDWQPAYTEMGHHLLNRGDYDAFYKFGVECLQTGRFDTAVPWQFVIYLERIRSDKQSTDLWRQPDVYANICKFFRENARDSRRRTWTSSAPRRPHTQTGPAACKRRGPHWRRWVNDSTNPCFWVIRPIQIPRWRGFMP